MSNYELITKDSISQLSKCLFTSREISYPELSLFKKQMMQNKNCPKHQPYTTHKRNLFAYKFVFFSLSALFACLGMIIFFKTGVWTPLIYLTLMGAAKKLICLVCIMLSTASFVVGWTLSPEKDAIKHYTAKSLSVLREIYFRKQQRFGIRRFFCFAFPYTEYILLKQNYLEVVSKIRQKKEKTIQLVTQIRVSDDLDWEEKETLYNQAIAELNDKLEAMLHVFSQSP